MIPFYENRQNKNRAVSSEKMQQIYDKLKTPYKFGEVIMLDGYYTDSPSVFFYDGTWYMYFIAISKDCAVSGYETHLAKSSDLVNWEYVCPVFRRNKLNHWDSNQCAGYAAFFDINFGKSNKLLQINSEYYISYLGGNSNGYEPDPLYMGIAKTNDPTNPNGFVRYDKPILSPDDSDSRQFEHKTLYKSFLFEDESGVTGHKYVNAYNAKDEQERERIYLAVSDDAAQWQRYGDEPVIDQVSDDPKAIVCGDPQIIKIDDVYVMLYFRSFTDKPAYDTFACSYDLVKWTYWQGKPLVFSEFEWENLHAHKPWVIMHNGVVYHYYCAVNSCNERFIAVATSKKLNDIK